MDGGTDHEQDAGQIGGGAAVVDDMVEYIYSLSSMTSLHRVPRQEIKEILLAHTADGVLNIPKEYGMFISF